MVKKIKIFFKKNILGIIIGGLIFGTAGVYAATYFPSYNVTYDNTESGLSSTDVQGAIDELYNECKTPSTGGNGILDQVEIVTSGDGLYEDEYEDGRYFYKGGNPNNYVTFNNEQAGWRIVSIEPDGTIKIMKNDSIGDIVWDTSGSNNWARPATLNTYLNRTYYNRLNVTAKNQIVSKDFSIGAVTYNNNDLADQINDENSIKWNGKVALATVSEYIRSNSNKSNCGTFALMNKNVNTCINTRWMGNKTSTIMDYWWTLSSEAANSDFAFRADEGIYGDYSLNYGVDSTSAVHPTLYLSSEVKITGGNGSENNPFVIE